MSKLPVFGHFLSVGNLKPKLRWFFKPKFKPKMFLLNRLPVDVGADPHGDLLVVHLAHVHQVVDLDAGAVHACEQDEFKLGLTCP